MLASIFSLNVIQTALELGCIYGLVALALVSELFDPEHCRPVHRWLLHPWLCRGLSGGADRPRHSQG